MESAGTPLQVDAKGAWLKRGGGAVLLFTAAGLGYLAATFGFAAGMGAFIAGIAGLSLLGASFSFAGTGPCPSCGATLVDVPRDLPGYPCPGCGEYAIVRGACLHRTPPEHVASSSTYAIAVSPEQAPLFGGMCVSCGAPATTTVARQMRKTVVGAPGVGRVVRTWPLPLPVCAAHAQLDSLGNPRGVTSSQGTLLVSSYAAWRAAHARRA
jgi:predicted RNA-binding Zn-ribbon protein involved in translation (DUF1610 family)